MVSKCGKCEDGYVKCQRCNGMGCLPRDRVHPNPCIGGKIVCPGCFDITMKECAKDCKRCVKSFFMSFIALFGAVFSRRQVLRIRE